MTTSAVQRPEPVPRRSLVFVGEQRLCRGPLHPEGEWLPPTAFYRHNDGSGRFFIRRICKSCYNHQRRPNGGWLTYERIGFAAEELVARLGIVEAERRSGVSRTTLRKYVGGYARYVHRTTAVKLIVALRKVRAENIVRHIDSVRHGAALRGRQEKHPELPSEYYVPKLRHKAEQEAKRLHELEGKHRSIARQRRRRQQREWVARKRALTKASTMRGVEPMNLYWETAEAVCTPKQLRVLELREKHGFSLRQIALTCDIALGTVRVHLDAAHRNIHKALKASA